MVTFTCEDCDTTLKKKQIKTHKWNCSASAFSCVDCHKRFAGNEVDAHIQCVTEQEKYWGQYYKGNKQVKTDPKANGANGTNGAAHTKQVEENGEEEKVEEGPITFTGWKSTLKALLKRESNSEMNKKDLKQKLKEILIKEDYEVEEKSFNESVDKVLGFRAFQVSKNNLVRYIPPSERPPKKSAKANGAKNQN